MSSHCIFSKRSIHFFPRTIVFGTQERLTERNDKKQKFSILFESKWSMNKTLREDCMEYKWAKDRNLSLLDTKFNSNTSEANSVFRSSYWWLILN